MGSIICKGHVQATAVVLLVSGLFHGTPLLAQDQTLAVGKGLRARWELVDSLRRGTFLLSPYKPVYVLPVVWSSDPNRDPRRTTDPKPSGNAQLPLDVFECKFQISIKTKVVQGLFKDHGDIWVGYTQSSRWQVYNYGLSRSFRETNYEPEVLVVIPTRYRIFGFHLRMVSGGLVHQSNGGTEPYSRSWNRLIFQVGLERGRFSLLLRPWWRFPEKGRKDENPGITGLTGNGEFIVIYQRNSHVFSVQVRKDCRVLVKMMQKATGAPPKLWGASIVGFGNYLHTSPASGRQVDWFHCGFSPRKANLSLYLMPTAFEQHAAALKQLGPHSVGKGCLYIKRLADVDLQVLEQLVGTLASDSVVRATLIGKTKTAARKA